MSETSPADAAIRVAVAADQLLVGQAVRTALAGRGLGTATIQWHPVCTEETTPAPQSATLHTDVGLLLCALDPLARVADALWLARQFRLPWLVVSEHHDRPGAGAMLEAGSVDVWPSDSSMDEVVALLRRAPHEPVQQWDAPAQLRRWHGLPRRTRVAVGRLAGLSGGSGT